MSKYKIRESGKNGVIEVHRDRLVRIIKRRIGKDDTQTIPLRSISSVHHDRKRLKTDTVQVQAGVVAYEWKVSDADRFVEEVNQLITQ